MSPSVTALLLVSSIFFMPPPTIAEMEALQMPRAAVLEAWNWVNVSLFAARDQYLSSDDDHRRDGRVASLSDCADLYEASEYRLARLLSAGEGRTARRAVVTWLSAVLANHITCLEGLGGYGSYEGFASARNLTAVLSRALALYNDNSRGRKGSVHAQKCNPKEGEKSLALWRAGTSRADLVVAKDGSGSHRTINEALRAVAKMGHNRPHRIIIYVKAGIYNEKVEIDKNMKNLMFVGDGMDKTIVTGNRNVPDGATTYSSTTFGVAGDGFWARDMTFENSAGPHKHQAVALRVNSDLAVLYRCSFRGYQDTLFVHSLRQFYRDCHIYGTIDFIFGDASAVFQNCDIFVRRPMEHQGNMITAQGRDNPNENTGITIQGSRVRPAPDLAGTKDKFKSYLGRPWRRYSRTVFIKTDLDGLIDPKGWTEWSGDFALSTLYYGEYMNTGNGAHTDKRVKWPGLHLFNGSREAIPFSVTHFIQGDSWISDTGVPFWPGV